MPEFNHLHKQKSLLIVSDPLGGLTVTSDVTLVSVGDQTQAYTDLQYYYSNSESTIFILLT